MRSRLKRGTLHKEKTRDGTVFVVLDGASYARENLGEADRLTTNQTTSPIAQQTDQPVLVDVLRDQLNDQRDQVAYLREQLDAEREANRENRRIIAALTQRIPELESPQEESTEPRGSSKTMTEGKTNDNPPLNLQESAQERSWLYRFFFGA